MDTHILGPRGGPSMGAVVSAQGVRVAFGDSPSSGHDICKTVGATPKNPLWVRVTGAVTTAFDGTSPVVKIIICDLDGSNPVDLATIAAPNKTVMITKDKLLEFVYTPGGGGSAGEAGYLIEVVGKGVLRSP
jgi:hypothetical protein